MYDFWLPTAVAALQRNQSSSRKTSRILQVDMEAVEIQARQRSISSLKLTSARLSAANAALENNGSSPMERGTSSPGMNEVEKDKGDGGSYTAPAVGNKEDEDQNESGIMTPQMNNTKGEVIDLLSLSRKSSAQENLHNKSSSSASSDFEQQLRGTNTPQKLSHVSSPTSHNRDAVDSPPLVLGEVGLQLGHLQHEDRHQTPDGNNIKHEQQGDEKHASNLVNNSSEEEVLNSDSKATTLNNNMNKTTSDQHQDQKTSTTTTHNSTQPNSTQSQYFCYEKVQPNPGVLDESPWWSAAVEFEWMRQLTKGMRAIHKKGFVHRDLKPQNCFLDLRQGLLKIGDFGLSSVSTTANSLSIYNAENGLLEPNAKNPVQPTIKCKNVSVWKTANFSCIFSMPHEV